MNKNPAKNSKFLNSANIHECASLPLLDIDSDSDDCCEQSSGEESKSENYEKSHTFGHCEKLTTSMSVTSKREFYTRKKVCSLPISKNSSMKKAEIRFDINQEYIFEKVLGVGTYGYVRLAQSKKTLNYVAIKMARGSTSIGMLKNEANIMRMLDSDFFPKFYDYIVDSIGNKAYLVMEYVNGQQLDEFSKSNGDISEIEARGYLKQIAEAVAFMHSKGVVHRDIKPQNIIVTLESKIKIIDFNISKASESLVHHEPVRSGCKFFGKFFTQVSSPLFSAPELSSLDYYTESIDIWGIGVLYLILLCGIDNFNASITTKVQKDEILSNLEESLNRHSDASKSLLAQLLSPVANDRPSIDDLMNSFAI